MPDVLETVKKSITQRTGANTGRLRTESERAAFAINTRADLSEVIDQINRVYNPLVSDLLTDTGIEPLDKGLSGNVLLSDVDATSSSATAYWDSVGARRRSVKETFDVVLAELARLENEIDRSAVGSGYDDTAITNLLNTNTNNLTQLRKDTMGGNYDFDADGNADLTYPLAQAIDAIGALFSGFPGTGVTGYAGSYPALSLTVNLSDVTLDTTVPESTITGLVNHLAYLRAFIGKDTDGSELPAYSAHGPISIVSDGDTLEEAIQKLDQNGGYWVYDSVGNVVANSNGDMANDSLVFGSDSLDDDLNPDHYIRMVFDKSQAFFAAGYWTSTEIDSRGWASAAFGDSVSVPGNYSVGFGEGGTVSGDHGVGAGRDYSVAGDYSGVLSGRGGTISATSGYNVIVGGGGSGVGQENVISGAASNTNVIGGGGDNTIDDSQKSVIAGGWGGSILNSDYATVSGGTDGRIGDAVVPSNGSVVGGGSGNYVYGQHSVIAGGYVGTVGVALTSASAYSFIGGGNHGSITSTGRNNAIVMSGIDGTGSDGNSITGIGNANFIGGGSVNVISAGDFGFIGNGDYLNITATGGYNFLGGGSSSIIAGAAGYAAIVSGSGHILGDGTVDSSNSVILGGDEQKIYGSNSVIGGGSENIIGVAATSASSYAGIFSGRWNKITATGSYNFIGGGGSASDGTGNEITGNAGYCSVVGGKDNTIAGGGYNIICGGTGNDLTSTSSITYGQFIGAGSDNTIGTTANNCGIVAGNQNTMGNNTTTALESFIGAGYSNQVFGQRSAVVGGIDCHIGSAGSALNYCFIGAGQYLTINSGNHNALLSGHYNTISASNGMSVICGGGWSSGGDANSISGSGGNDFIGGGRNNTITAGSYQGIMGGRDNTITSSGDYNTIIGGYAGTVSGTTIGATVLGGYGNYATGNYSSVSGYQALSQRHAERVHSAGQIAAGGDAQEEKVMWRYQTVGYVASQNLFLDGSSAVFNLDPNSTYGFKIRLIARRTDADGENLHVTFEGTVTRDGTAASTTFEGVPVAVEFSNTGGFTYSLTVDTSGYLRILVDGVGGKTINWVAHGTFLKTIG